MQLGVCPVSVPEYPAGLSAPESVPRLGQFTIAVSLAPDRPALLAERWREGPSDFREQLRRAASVLGPAAAHLCRLVPGAQPLTGYLALGSWRDTLEPSCRLTVLTTEDRAIAIGAALGLVGIQGEVLVAGRGGPVAGLDVRFPGGHSVGDAGFVRTFWTECRGSSGGRLAGFAPRRAHNIDALDIYDLAGDWPRAATARSWVCRAATRVNVPVLVRTTTVSATTVANDWSVDHSGEGYLRLLATLGRQALAEEAIRLAAEVHRINRPRPVTVPGQATTPYPGSPPPQRAA